ncbi:ninein isoform X1 [Strigops habroptila]|uniref:ninein isoform X1 n=1 Tax=Strigops habroptila TaxID=2489341 RepID=UPI0011CF66CD|nr:ninein isoform X1 [Strigops habroptila]XP_030340722.1 ninein isoform X1 [Strigops habroptila]XP_030340723.1 ninein isoform X1 [Strigops habroptila]XP_030340724.1 ninein isoform X1 [Strigops habroptila]XP_030340725.1 ninein isoform X1 [Strigops habroptila]
MDEAEQDQYEARLKELFDSFDSRGTGSLGQEELTDLCHVLHLEEVAPALQQTLLQDNLLGRVHFDQFKEALILILSRTLSNEERFQEPDSSPEAQPKYIKGGKRYGRRSLPEFQESVEDFAEVTVIEPLSEEACPPHIASSGCEEHWKTRDSEEYEAEGQLRFWNPDDLNASPGASLPSLDWIEEKLQEVCEHLGITRDGHLNRKKLVSICEQYGLQTAAGEVLEEVLHNLEQDGTMSIEDFFYGLFKNGKPLTPSASTPYRQLKRHLSMQSFDESGRRTITHSAMSSTISFCLFSSLDDGMGYGCVEGVLDCWHQEGIENSQEILKALDFSLDGKVNLTELTLALENELLITKNGIHQAALASFKMEIRHLLERADQVAREKEKLRSDLEKAEKLKFLMASEVDDHHAAIERRNEYNLRKLDEEYKERIAALKNELQREREQILQQANKQRLDLEQEIEKLKNDENYIRDRLALSLKKNSRLESELLEMGEKLSKYESLASKLQRNLENVLTEKFGDLDPSSTEFFLQEERLAQMRSEYQQQCRELQDQIDELHSELEEYRAQGKVLRPSLKNLLSEEFDIDMKSHGNSGIEPDQGLGSEDCNPLNMSIEAEMAIEQMKEQHHRDLHHLRQELEDTVSHYEKQLDETKIHSEKEQEDMRKKYTEEMHVMEKQITGLKNQIVELQGEAAVLREQQEKLDCKHNDEKNKLQMHFDEEKANLQELLRQEHEKDVRARLDQINEKFSQEREELIQNGVWVEEKMRVLVQTLQEEKVELERGFHEELKRMAEVHALEKEELQQELLRKHEQDLEEERKKMESDYNRRASHVETPFSANTQTLVNKYEETIQNLEGHYQRELHELAEQQREAKSQWEFEKDEIAQKVAEAHKQLKESLANEKAISFALTQEKDLLEKNFKEEVNKLVSEREQLQKELQDLRNAAEKQEKRLNDEITQLQNDHKKELKSKEERISMVEENGKLFRQKLERLYSEYKQEKEDLNSKLLALESLNQDICVRAETEKAEMSLEILNLQGKIKKLQCETHCLSALQNHYRVLENEYAKAKSRIASFSGMAPLGDDVDVLLNLQKVHEQAVKENVRMAAEIVRLQHKLQVAERELVQPPSPGCSYSGSEQSQLPDEMDPIFEGLPSDCKDADKGTDLNILPLLEADCTDLEEMTEMDSDLEKACVKARAGSHAFKVQVCQMQGRKAAVEAAVVNPNNIYLHKEREERHTVEHSLQSTCTELQQKVDLLRFEAEKLREENTILKNEVTLLNEEGSASSLKLRELNGSREEMRQKIETVRKEKVAVQKMVDNLKKQVADLKTRNQQLDSENTELSQRNSKNQADVQDLNQQLARVLKQKEREAGKCTLEEWEKERLVLKEELKNSKVKSSNMVSSLEMELSKMKVQARILEQENHILKQELEKTKQLPRCPDFSDLQNEVSSLVTKNEKLQKEKEALSEELNRCIDKVAKASCLENAVGNLKQEQKSWEQQSQTLKMQLTVSQEKVQSLDETLQNTNLQMSRLKSDLRVTQQEKETLKQEVMSLHKQLQNANEKNRVLELAVPSSGLQDQQGQIHWDELDQLTKQEQQLLRQENERLQREVQSAKTDLTHSREKIRQLESTILSLKHQKHQSQLGIVKAIEQEKLSLKRECEQLQKELSSANRKISQMNSLERELETSSENEGLRKKQVKLDDQLMEMLHSSTSVILSHSPHSRELQQQGCAMVPKEQFLQLQHQLLQAERRSQRLQEELESRPSETNMQQGGHEQLLKMMEERMVDVEQKLRHVKRLLQDKVNQLKEQLSKNTKADAMVKDLYVENAQLLKALEMTEQRQRTAEKKNYLLEEKIANLNRIVKNLASPSFNSASEIRS